MTYELFLAVVLVLHLAAFAALAVAHSTPRQAQPRPRHRRPVLAPLALRVRLFAAAVLNALALQHPTVQFGVVQ